MLSNVRHVIRQKLGLGSAQQPPANQPAPTFTRHHASNESHAARLSAARLDARDKLAAFGQQQEGIRAAQQAQLQRQREAGVARPTARQRGLVGNQSPERPDLTRANGDLDNKLPVGLRHKQSAAQGDTPVQMPSKPAGSTLAARMAAETGPLVFLTPPVSTAQVSKPAGSTLAARMEAETGPLVFLTPPVSTAQVRTRSASAPVSARPAVLDQLKTHLAGDFSPAQFNKIGSAIDLANKAVKLQTALATARNAGSATGTAKAAPKAAPVAVAEAAAPSQPVRPTPSWMKDAASAAIGKVLANKRTAELAAKTPD